MTKAAHASSATGDLYEADLCLWAERQAGLLRVGRWPEVDVVRVAEEIESVGASQKSEIRSRLAVLLLHLLKWDVQPEKRKYGWRATIIEQRIRIDGLIEDSPSLRVLPAAILPNAYRLAVTGASAETGLAGNRFPATCPYTIDQILDLAFYPGPIETEVV